VNPLAKYKLVFLGDQSVGKTSMLLVREKSRVGVVRGVGFVASVFRRDVNAIIGQSIVACERTLFRGLFSLL
jgi:GTPase SAR1 family protein